MPVRYGGQRGPSITSNHTPDMLINLPRFSGPRPEVGIYTISWVVEQSKEDDIGMNILYHCCKGLGGFIFSPDRNGIVCTFLHHHTTFIPLSPNVGGSLAGPENQDDISACMVLLGVQEYVWISSLVRIRLCRQMCAKEFPSVVPPLPYRTIPAINLLPMAMLQTQLFLSNKR